MKSGNTMKVCHVLSGIDPQHGGPTTALLGLAEAQVAAGLEVTIVASYYTTEPKLAALERMRSLGAQIRLFGPAHGRLHRHPRNGPELEAALATTEVIHIHGLWDDLLYQAAWRASRRSMPFIFRPCGMLDPWSLAQRRWRKRFYLWWRLRRNLDGAAAIHFTSETERDLASPLGIRAPVVVEPNGIDLREFETLPPPGTFRARYHLPDGTPIVLFLSRLHPKKGLDLLVPAFARIQPSNAVLVIAGPDEDGYQTRVERWVAECGVADRVLFTGMLTGADKLAALADADLFVLPSYQENFGIAVVEALAAGTPVVVSDQVNIWREIVAAGAGAVVRTDVENLAATLTTWLGDSRRREAAAQVGRPFALARYDWTLIAARWREHYQRIASGPGFRETDSQWNAHSQG